LLKYYYYDAVKNTSVGAGILPGIKRLRLEMHCSLPSGAGFKNDWSFRSVPPYAFDARTDKLFLHYDVKNT
jgi:hypothetical protein